MTKCDALVLFSSFLLTIATPMRGAPQAQSTANKTMDISAFGGYASASVDTYTQTRASGFVLGADITRYFKFPVVPSLETRMNFFSSPTASERSYLFGFRVEPKPFVRFPKIRPYADFLVGPGNVHFTDTSSGYMGDNSVVTSIGGGVDFNLYKNFSLKVDYQKQHWNTGELPTNPGVVTFGIKYRFPFRPRFSQEEMRK